MEADGIQFRGESGRGKMMKNWERFEGWFEASEHYRKNLAPALTRMEWGIGTWLYMDHIEGETRLEFLRRCDETKPCILTCEGRKELNKLEKSAARMTHKEGGEG